MDADVPQAGATMSSKHPKPKNPEKLLTTREDVINFMNYISTDENFCLRVWNTVQGVHDREKAKQEADRALMGMTETELAAEAVMAVPA